MSLVRTFTAALVLTLAPVSVAIAQESNKGVVVRAVTEPFTNQDQPAIDRYRAEDELIGILAAVLFAYLIVVPVISLLLEAGRVQLGDERRTGGDTGSFTLYYITRTLTSPVATQMSWQPLVNTFTVAFSVIAISLFIGCILAWLLSRTDMFARRWFATALIVPFMLPSWTFALAWTTLLRNRSVGGRPGWLESMGVTPPDWLAYGQVPVTVILALHYTPFVILLFGNALRRRDSQL
jgi:iron(III) transport system permease protein